MDPLGNKDEKRMLGWCSRQLVHWLDPERVQLDTSLAKIKKIVPTERWADPLLKFTVLHDPSGDLVQTKAKEVILALETLKTRFNII